MIDVLDELAEERWSMRRRKNSPKDSRLKRLAYGRHCKNPWNGPCENADIVVYIHFKDEKRPICRSCWTDISKNGLEW